MKQFEPYGYNGGKACDTLTGHCACGAKHSIDSLPMHLTQKGKDFVQSMKQKGEQN